MFLSKSFLLLCSVLAVPFFMSAGEPQDNLDAHKKAVIFNFLKTAYINNGGELLASLVIRHVESMLPRKKAKRKKDFGVVDLEIPPTGSLVARAVPEASQNRLATGDSFYRSGR